MIAAAAAGVDEGAAEQWPGASERAGIYRLLASGFLEPPTPERMALLGDGELSVLFGNALPVVPATSGEALEEARQDFMDLLKVPVGRFVPPYEAVHRDSRIVDGQPTRGLLMGPSTVDVRRLYQDAGASLELPELPDHIGVELSFMAFLCDEEARSAGLEEAENYRRYQKGFLGEHLLSWVPTYCQIVAERASTLYMKTLARMTAEFCRSDLERME